jgi:hypothetical protein
MTYNELSKVNNYLTGLIRRERDDVIKGYLEARVKEVRREIMKLIRDVGQPEKET